MGGGEGRGGGRGDKATIIILYVSSLIIFFISVSEVNFGNTSIVVLESDSEVEVCLILTGSSAEHVMITVGIAPNGEQCIPKPHYTQCPL